MPKDNLIEKRAREIFEKEKTEYERWDIAFVHATPGKDVVAAIDLKRKEHYKKLAKSQLEAEGII